MTLREALERVIEVATDAIVEDDEETKEALRIVTAHMGSIKHTQEDDEA